METIFWKPVHSFKYIGANGLEMANSFRGKPILPMEGWAKGVTWNMNMYNRPLRQIHRQSGFRGFGGNQGMMAIENIIDNISRFLGKDPSDVRRLNFYQKNKD